MKFCATLAVLAAVLITKSEAAPADALHNLDGLVTVATEYLKVAKELWKLKGKVVFEQSLAKRKEKLLQYVDSSRDEVQKKLKNAEEAGTDVTQCSKTYESQVSGAVDQVLVEAKKCLEQNPPKLDKVLGEIDDLLIRGEELAAQIEKIEEDCRYENSFTEQICIAKNLPKVGIRVRLYKRAVGQLGDGALTIINDSLTGIRRCAGPALENLEGQLENAKDYAVTCAESGVVPEATESSQQQPQTPEVQPGQVSDEQ